MRPGDMARGAGREHRGGMTVLWKTPTAVGNNSIIVEAFPLLVISCARYGLGGRSHWLVLSQDGRTGWLDEGNMVKQP